MRRRSTVGGWLSYRDLALPSRPAAPQIADTVGRMHGTGATAKEIATALGLSTSTVIRILASIATIPSEPTP